MRLHSLGRSSKAETTLQGAPQGRLIELTLPGNQHSSSSSPTENGPADEGQRCPLLCDSAGYCGLPYCCLPQVSGDWPADAFAHLAKLLILLVFMSLVQEFCSSASQQLFSWPVCVICLFVLERFENEHLDPADAQGRHKYAHVHLELHNLVLTP